MKLITIYEAVLKMAKNGTYFPYPIIFDIPEKESADFWNDKSLSVDHEELLSNFEPNTEYLKDGKGVFSTYTRVLCGIKFGIKFNYSSKS